MRILGPSLSELQKRSDEFETAVSKSLRVMGRYAAESLDNIAPSESDLIPVRAAWGRRVRDDLLPMIEQAWLESASDMWRKLQTAADRVDRDRRRAVAAPSAPQVAAATSVFSQALVAAPVPKVHTSAAEEYLASATNRMVGIGDQLWGHIRDQLYEGVQNGESLSDIQHRIRVTAPELSEGRAMVAARTEVIGASNRGSLAQIDSTGLGYFKEWIATGGPRTRAAHSAVDGTQVRNGETFTVDGYPMDGPHDPGAPAELVINCRCTLGYEIADEEFDIPLVAAADSEYDQTACIMAIPAKGDLVHSIGPNDKHATILYFGDRDKHEDPERMESSKELLQEALAATAADQEPFTATVTGIESLGDGDPPAQVWMLDSPDLQRLFNKILKINQEVQILYDGADATRYPEYTPHVTIGYGSPEIGTEKGLVSDDELSEAAAVSDISFDRLSLWWGNEHIDYQLGEKNAKTDDSANT